MKVNGESIYGTRSTPFKSLSWGRCTVKDAGADTLLYLHVLNWPADGKLLIPGLANSIKAASLLAGGAPLPVEKSPSGPLLSLPAAAPDAICTTIKVLIQGKPEVTSVAIGPGKDGNITLLAADSILLGKQIRVEQKDKLSNIGYWYDPGDIVSWDICADHDGKFSVLIETAAPAAGAVLKFQGVGNLAYSVPKTADYTTYQTGRVGEIVLTKGARGTLTLRPVAEGWNPINCRKVILVPEH